MAKIILIKDWINAKIITSYKNELGGFYPPSSFYIWGCDISLFSKNKTNFIYWNVFSEGSRFRLTPFVTLWLQ